MVGGVAQHVSLGGEVAGDDAHSQFLNLLNVGLDGGGAFAGVTRRTSSETGAVLTRA